MFHLDSSLVVVSQPLASGACPFSPSHTFSIMLPWAYCVPPWRLLQVPVCFVPVRGRETRTNASTDLATSGGSAGYSYQNDDEASVVSSVVAALLTPGSGLEGPGDIGIVTPYNGQVRGCAAARLELVRLLTCNYCLLALLHYLLHLFPP